jgi:hypothetical protein
MIKPTVVQLGPTLFDAGGLLPMDVAGIHFVVRSVFSRSRWCERRLTAHEHAAAMDVPLHVVNTLTKQELARLAIFPARTFERCTQVLLGHVGVLDRGGRLSLDGAVDLSVLGMREEREVNKERGIRKEMDQLSEGSKNLGTVSDSKNVTANLDTGRGPLTTSDTARNPLKNVSTRCEEGASATKFNAKLSTISTVGASTADVGVTKLKLPESVVAEKLREPVLVETVSEEPVAEESTGDPECVDGQKSEATRELEEEQKRIRDFKATKADGAAAPIWLWNDALRKELEEDPSKRGFDEPQIDAALETLRKFLLDKKVKRDVTRSFFAYVHSEYPGLGQIDQPEVDWVNGQYH